MTTFTAIAFNAFQTIGLIHPCIEVMVREVGERTEHQNPFRMQWVRTTDANGRRVLRLQWVETPAGARR